jgi:hypothetical protein
LHRSLCPPFNSIVDLSASNTRSIRLASIPVLASQTAGFSHLFLGALALRPKHL